MPPDFGASRTNKVQIARTATPNRPPDPKFLAEGELFVEMATSPVTLWIGVPLNVDPTGRVMIATAVHGAGMEEPPPDGRLYGRNGQALAWEVAMRPTDVVDGGIF